jgi:alpha-tubulin suppressor-like RCC1 family protein
MEGPCSQDHSDHDNENGGVDDKTAMADLWQVGVAKVSVATVASSQFDRRTWPATIAAEKLQAATRDGAAASAKAILRGSVKLEAAVLSDALRIAAKCGHADVLKLLIEHGADVNAPDADGYTCFHEACFWGQHAVLPLLAAKGVRARSLTRVGRTGWDLATRNGCSKAAAVLVSLGMQEVGDLRDQESHVAARLTDSQPEAEAEAPTPPAVVGCGSNLRGQLGCPDAPTTAAMIPVPLPDELGALPIALVGCGAGHTLFVAQGGQDVFGCGSNADGQLGLGRIAHPNHSAQCDTVIDIVTAPTRVRALCGLSLTALACGDSHTLALTAAGSAMCCGANESAQLGLGHVESPVWKLSATPLTGITSVGAGSFHSFFLKIPEAVWACGNNSLGQLGLAGGSIVTAPKRVAALDGQAIVQMACGATQSWFLTAEGAVWHIIGVEWPPAPPPQKLRTLPADDEVVALSAGGHHCLFLTASGVVCGVGSNTSGQLGIVASDGSSIPAVTEPCVVEAFQRLTHCFVRLSAHGVKLAKLGRGCLREGDVGQVISRDASGRRSKVKGGRLGKEAWYTDELLEPTGPPLHGIPTERPPSTRIVSFLTGHEHSMFMMASGEIWSCGRNDKGQCGVSLPGGSVGRDVGFPIQLPVSPGLYSLPTCVAGCLASSSFLIRRATMVPPPSNRAQQLMRTHTIRLHTPPLPRAIVYEDPAVVLAQTSSQAAVQSATETTVEMQPLQPSELKELLKRTEAYVDPDFPPLPRSLAHDWDKFYNGNTQEVSRGLLWTEIEWKRPSEIKLHSQWESNPEVFVDGVDADDIQQGHLGDCYFLSCLSVLADHPGMIERLILTPTVTASGVFAARFCKHGVWHDVVIDDNFPCVQRQDDDEQQDKPEDEDKHDAAMKAALSLDDIDPASADRNKHWSPAFSQARDGELWPCILEKAWAKLHGSYQAIESGDPSSTLRDLTGAPSQFVSCDDVDCDADSPPLLWQAMLDADRKGYLMAAGMAASLTRSEYVRADGLIAGHCYGILKAVDLGCAEQRLIKLRNPWGKTEWTGDWSDSSTLWTAQLKKKLGFTAAEDGTFWMQLRDFANHFEGVHINHCHPTWQYRFVEHPPVLLPEDQTSTTLCFRVVIPPSQRDEHAAVLTVSQRDVRVLTGSDTPAPAPAPAGATSTTAAPAPPPGGSAPLPEELGGSGVIGATPSSKHPSMDPSSSYAACTLSVVRVDSEALPATAAADPAEAEERVVKGSSVLLQGRDSWLETALPPGTYVVSAHLRLCSPRPADGREVPVVFSCYSALPAAIVSNLSTDEAWLAQAEILMALTERFGTSDDTMYKHRIGEDTKAGEDRAARDLSLKVYQSKTLRLFCMLHRNGGGKQPCLLAEEIKFGLVNMEIWTNPADDNVEVDAKGDDQTAVRLSIAPGERTFLIVRPKSLGRYSVNYSREVSFEPVQ